MSTPPQYPPYAPMQQPAVQTGTGSSPTARLVSAAAGLILTVLLVVLGAGMSGSAYYRLVRMDLRPATMIPVVAFGLGAVVVAFLLALIIRISSTGAYVGAAILLVIGLLTMVVPQLALRTSMSLGQVFRGGEVFVISGMPIILAALLAGAGVAASLQRRRQPRTPVRRS